MTPTAEPDYRFAPEHLLRCGVPRMIALAFHNGVIDDELIPEPLRTWATKLPHSAHGFGALLAGGTGTGKSVAAAWMLRAYYGACWRKDRDGRPNPPNPGMRFAQGVELARAIRARDKQWLLAHTRARLLVLDDFPVIEADWLTPEVEAFFEARYGECLMTIVTTNQMVEAARRRGAKLDDPAVGTFEKVYPRVASRLMDRRGVGFVPVTGTDKRRKRGTQ